VVGNTGNVSANHNHALSGNTDSTGSGTAHNNIQPYLTLNFIIKAIGSFTPPASIGGVINGTSFNAYGTTGTDIGFSAIVTGDSNQRFTIDDSGKQSWGPGNNVTDTNLYRSAAGTLQTDGAIRTIGASAGAGAYATQVTGDTQNRYLVAADGGMSWGSGSATRDTNLYRNGVDSLKTDDFFAAAGGLSAKGIEIDPASAASGTLLRHNGTKYVSVAEESVAQYPNAIAYRAAPNPGGTASTSYVNMGAASVSFTKNKAGTKIRVFAAGTFYFSAGGTGGGSIGININSTD